jgi:hypothetical protein
MNILWTEADWPENSVDGYAAQKTVSLKALVEQANAKKGRKPAAVYIAKEGSDEKAIAKLEKDMFGDDDVAIALRFFHPIRLEAKAIPDEELRVKYAKTAPAILFLDADGNQVSELAGRFDAKAILSRLDKVYGTHYAGKLSSLIAKVMDSIQRSERAEDKVADSQKRIEDLQSRLADKDSDVVRKSLDEERKKLAELQKDLAKVEDERTKLFSPTQKESKEVVKGG